MKIKTSKLTGAALDWAVLEASGNPSNLEWGKAIYGGLQVRMTVKLLGIIEKNWAAYGPSTIWSQGGPILDREKISTVWTPKSGYWSAYRNVDTAVAIATAGIGPTLLIAAMRCYVVSRLGEEVDVPEELV